MCTKACYWNGKFTSRKLVVNMSDILALARLGCHRTSLPTCQKPAQRWSQSQESHQSHQAPWATIAAGTGFRHGVMVDGLAQTRVREGNMRPWWVVKTQSKWSVVSQCGSLCFLCLFHKHSPFTEDVMWNRKSLWSNCLQLIKWYTIIKITPRWRKTRDIFIPQPSLIFCALWFYTINCCI